MAESTKTEAIEFLMELADKTGVAVSSVSDGHIAQILEKIEQSGQDKCVIFVQSKPPVQN